MVKFTLYILIGKPGTNYDGYGAQFSSVQDGIYELEIAHKRSIPSLRSFANAAFEMVSKCLIDDGAFKKGRRAAITCSTPLDRRSTV